MRECRLKRYYILQDEMLGLFAEIRGEMVLIELPNEQNQIPADAEVESVHYCHDSRAFALYVWSASFDIVEPGAQIPDAADPFRIIHCAVLKRRSILETHEPDTPEQGAKLAAAQQSWRERDPLL